VETEFSEEQERLRESVRRFLAERAPLSLARELWDAPHAAGGAVWKGLVELGLVGLLAPEAAGGAGGDLRDMGVVLEEMGRVVHPGPFLATAVGAVSAAQALAAADLLPGLAAGSRVGTLALAEPGLRFPDWSRPATRAPGDRLTGEKLGVADGAAADLFFVTAQEGVYLVEAGAPGLTLEPTPTVDGSRRFARLRLDGTPARRLGPCAALAPAVDRCLVALAVDGLGAAEAALELAVAHAREREQFGQPIGAFQAVAHLCADMLQAVELGRACIHYALWAVDAADAQERHRAAVMAKAWASLAFPRVGADAIQVFGGAGFSWEFDVHLYYKRLLSLEQDCGTADEWLEELAGLLV
jgi:acyl-CoA dehydrogenase